jgi:type II secretory pathway component PulK
MDRRRGSILILALWTMTFLSFLMITLSGQVRQNITFFQNLDSRERLRLSAEAGVKLAADHLRVRETGSPYSLSESAGLARGLTGALNGVGFKVVEPVPEEKNGPSQEVFSPLHQNQTEINSNIQKWTTTYGIIDENRKINLNRADRFLITRLFSALGLKEEDAIGLAAEAVDYRDSDDAVTATAGVGGSEESRYRAAGLDYSPKNADYEFVAELLRLPGMTEDLYRMVRPFLTVYGDGTINLNTVTSEVLSLVDLHPAVAAKIFKLRAGPDGVEGSSDDMVFASQPDLEDRLKSIFGLKEQERLSLRHAFARRLVSLGSNYFSVVSVAADKQAQNQTLAVYGVRRGIQRWVEHS